MKINSLLIILIVLSLLGTLLVFDRLPDKVPGHFNIKGEVDRYDNKGVLIFTGSLPLIIYLLMVFLPKIDPKKSSYLKHKKAYKMTQVIIIIFFIMIQWIMIMVALGFNINVGMVVRIGVGILFIVIGNFMSQIRQNYFFGIKTPWTLANETVWKKTHRAGAFSFLIGGLILIASSFTYGTIAAISLISAIAIAGFYPIIYSYIVYKKISKE